jgi:RNA polymerase sporulation-specific sigma factor
MDKSTERELICKAKEGTKPSMDTLVRNNMGIITSLANKYVTDTISVHELISVGVIALIESIHKFDTSKDVKVIDYAKLAIVWAMKVAKAKHFSIVSRSGNTDRIGKAQHRSVQLHGKNYTRIGKVEDDSLDAPISEDDDGLTRLDVLEQLQPTQEERLLEAERIMRLRLALSYLPLKDVQSRIIHKWLSDEDTSLRSIAKELGVSHQYLSNVEAKLLETLRNNLTEGN